MNLTLSGKTVVWRLALSGFFAVLLCAGFVLSADIGTAQAQGYCWCQKDDGSCENHRRNAEGEALCNTSSDSFCIAYCRSRGWSAQHCDPIDQFIDYTVNDPTGRCRASSASQRCTSITCNCPARVGVPATTINEAGPVYVGSVQEYCTTRCQAPVLASDVRGSCRSLTATASDSGSGAQLCTGCACQCVKHGPAGEVLVSVDRAVTLDASATGDGAAACNAACTTRCTAEGTGFEVERATPQCSARGNNCWCKKQDGQCEHHTQDDARQPLNTQVECNTYCSTRGRSRGESWQAVFFDTTYTDRACRAECGGSGCDTRTGGTLGSEQPAAPQVAFQARTSVVGQLFNPLGSTVTIQGAIGRGIKAVLGLIGALALLMFVWGGVLWVSAGGNDKRVAQATTILKNSFIGLLIIMFSYTIVALLFGVLSGSGA